MNDLESMVDGLVQGIADEREAFRAKIKAFFDIKFHPTLAALMGNDIDSVTWTQYTPYFNDGDKCVFAVQEVSFGVNGMEYDGYYLLPKNTTSYNRAIAIERYLIRLDELDVLNLAYGDHKRVTATKDTIYTELYSDHY